MLLATGNCVQMMCGCLAYHSVYRSSGQDSALLAVFTVASGNGALYLLAFTKLTPLPFRWPGRAW